MTDQAEPSPSRIPQVTRPDPTTAGSGFWRLRNWRLRTKLFAVLLVPLLLAGTLGVLRISSAAQQAAALDALVGQVGRGQQVTTLVHELQRERNLAAGFVAGNRAGDRSGLDQQIAVVDAELAAFSAAAPADFGPAAADVHDAARVRLQGLGPLRTATAATSYPADAVVVAYTSVIDTLLTLNRTVLTAADGSLLRQASDVTVIADATEQVERQHATVLAALLTGTASATQQAAARAADAQLGAALVEFDGSALPDARRIYSDTVSGAEVDNRERIEQGVLVSFTTGALPTAFPAEWDASSTRTADLLREVETALQDGLRDDGAALAAAARGEAIRDAVILGLLVLLALAALAVVARSLLRPLRILRAGAFDVADRRLPEAIERMQTTDGSVPDLTVEPIGVDTREEVGEVARAFDAVHSEAVRLAAQQALLRANVNDIFVNLSRRSQGLVQRQLRLIDELEGGEQDPEQLGNLFQLDHLATRMRRNNENLLVLAGADLRQRRGRPVAALDVLRASVSEIEEYARVAVRRAPAVSVAGAVVNDLVHLVAELLDNATSYSPPDSRVVLSSSLDEGRLLVEITDNGVGIERADLADLNAQLAAPPVVDVAVSRRMGLFVVGRLAQRHDLIVRLWARTAGAGLVASVLVPAVHVISDDTVGRPPESDATGPDVAVPAQTAVLDAPDDRDLPAPPEPAVPAPPGRPSPRRRVHTGGPSGAAARPAAGSGTGDTGNGSGAGNGIRYTPWAGHSSGRAGASTSEGGDPDRAGVANGAGATNGGGRPDPAPAAPLPSARGAAAEPVAPMFAESDPREVAPHPTKSADSLTAPPAAAAGQRDSEPIFDEMMSAWFHERRFAPVRHRGTGPALTPAEFGARSPGGSDRAPAEPVVAEPAAGEPVAVEPAAGEPGPVEPAAASEPVPAEPVPAEPAAVESAPAAIASAQSSPAPASPHRTSPAGPVDVVRGKAGSAGAPDLASPPAPPSQVGIPAGRFAPEPTPADRVPGSSPASGQVPPPRGPSQQPAPPDEWGPASEETWRAALAALNSVPPELTAAGLPKRRPRANLMPGAITVGDDGGADPGAAPTRPRSPELVRGRLSSYQRGLREGRSVRSDVAAEEQG